MHAEGSAIFGLWQHATSASQAEFVVTIVASRPPASLPGEVTCVPVTSAAPASLPGDVLFSVTPPHPARAAEAKSKLRRTIDEILMKRHASP
jgi:hypothetical protein